MPNGLSQMTLEELWQLFPIFLVEHDQAWQQQYDEMADTLSELLSGFQVQRISHIGSTAIDGIMAKDIVDILVELPEHADMEEAASTLEQAGFTVMSSEGGRVSFNRDAYTAAKTDFIKAITARAKIDNLGRY